MEKPTQKGSCVAPLWVTAAEAETGPEVQVGGDAGAPRQEQGLSSGCR